MNAAHEAAIRRLVAKYTALLGLERWTIRIRFDERMRERAWCRCEWENMEATLAFNLARMAQEEDDDELIVRHEMLHILVWPVGHAAGWLAGKDKAAKELVRFTEECAVEQLGRMPIWQQID